MEKLFWIMMYQHGLKTRDVLIWRRTYILRIKTKKTHGMVFSNHSRRIMMLGKLMIYEYLKYLSVPWYGLVHTFLQLFHTHLIWVSGIPTPHHIHWFPQKGASRLLVNLGLPPLQLRVIDLAWWVFAVRWSPTPSGWLISWCWKQLLSIWDHPQPQGWIRCLLLLLRVPRCLPSSLRIDWYQVEHWRSLKTPNLTYPYSLI